MDRIKDATCATKDDIAIAVNLDTQTFQDQQRMRKVNGTEPENKKIGRDSRIDGWANKDREITAFNIAESRGLNDALEELHLSTVATDHILDEDFGGGSSALL